MPAIEVVRWRERHHLSREKLAQKLPVDLSVLAAWETGAETSPAYLVRALRDLDRQMASATAGFDALEWRM